MFRISVLVALLSLGLLVGCGDDQVDNWNDLDQALGGQELNGCDGTSAAYTDLRGRASVTITDISAWEDPHKACIGVSPGTAVTWVGNFDTHPLVGGVSPTTDSGSPITQADASGTGDMATTTVTFTATQITVEPYFCDVHRATMGGVIAVVP
jgi:plastocyanin